MIDLNFIIFDLFFPLPLYHKAITIINAAYYPPQILHAVPLLAEPGRPLEV